MMTSTYPVRVDGGLDPHASRWLWRVKWLLKQFFDLILGLSGWVLRVAADASLMTDDSPPFRHEPGSAEPSDSFTHSPPPTPGLQEPTARPPVAEPKMRRRGWTGGRITALVAGSVLALISLGLLAGGGLATWADNTQRDPAGYLTTGTQSFSTSSYALTSGNIDLGSSTDIVTPSALLGTVRVRVTPNSPERSVFLGIAPEAAVNRFLAGVNHDEVTDWANGTTVSHRSGDATPSPPAVAGIWTAKSSGTGTQTVTWKPRSGDWTVVVMKVNASPGLDVTADLGATVPDLVWIAVGLFAVGGLLLVLAGGLILIPIKRARR